MSRLVTVELDPGTLSAVQAQAPAWGVEVEPASSSFDPSRVRADEIMLIVVGDVHDPIQTAQRVHVSAPGIPVVLVAGEDECAALNERLKFSVFVGSDVRCLPRHGGPALLDEIRSTLDRLRRRRAHQRTVSSLNDKLLASSVGGRSAVAMLGRLLEVAPIGVVVTDEDALIRAVNPRAELLLGATEEQLGGCSLWQAFQSSDHDELRALLGRFNGDPAGQPRAVVPGRSGQVLEVTGARLDGPSPGFLVLLTDVTERFDLIAQLEQANRRKDEFLAMLGHELRNPLAPIRTAIDIMGLRDEPGSRRERAIIERQVAHLVDLLDDLLDVSRITRGRLSLRRQPVEIATVTRKAVEMSAPLLEQHQHHLRVDVPDTGLMVDGDPARLAQVVANLLTNAGKYTQRGGQIELEAARAGDQVVIAVRDNGPGIDADMLPQVFDLFVQKAQSLDRAAGGLGIGLAIVRSLVEMHGGTVAVASTPAQGSQFTVRLPVLDGGAAAVTEAPAPVARELTRPLCILIVDDNEDAALLLQDLLRSVGYRTAVAGDGPSALAQAAELQPDVVLLDIGLPVMDGYEVARRLRAMPGLEHLPLIGVTGYGTEADRARSRQAGFDDHLVKPIDFEALHEAIVRITEA